MICLVVLLFFYPFINVAGINLTYFVKTDRDNIKPSCIAEELERYAAIGWVYPIPSREQDIPNITTKYFPVIDNDYNCKFSQHSLCNTRWSLRDWKIDEISPKTRDFITDRRWEDLPTILISNTTKDFKERVELENVLKSAFSVRADGIVEIFVCSGWNPHNYPCYYFNIDQREIYFKLYTALPSKMTDDYKSSSLEYYRAYSNILSHDEWRNFILSLDRNGLVKLIDVNLNRTLIEHTAKQPLTPMYMFMRSSNSSLWKIHQNHFLYTNSTQISRLGPQINLFNKDLCVSLFVTTCDNCEMNFFYQNGTVRKMLKYIEPMKNKEWKEIKLKEENIQIEKVNIFVETKFVSSILNTTGYWAIDDVRICNENEVKVTFLDLKTTNNISEDEISCELISKPSWRPKKYSFDKIKDFPEVSGTTNSTSLKLSWAREDPTNQLSYFISYKANDICTSEPYNFRRIKSNGFLSTKLNEVTIHDLIPYTVYNVTISTVLHEKDKLVFFNTLETEEPSLEELPFKIQLKAAANKVQVSWKKVSCFSKYGRLVYSLIVSNEKLNFTKELSLQTDNQYEIDGLRPYTQYSLKILTARNGRNIYRGVRTNSIVLNFTTTAGVAPPVQNLEIYSIDKNFASLRYDLPPNPQGIVQEIQVSKCNNLSYNKCKSSISRVKRCGLWRGKYCVDVNYLIPFQTYKFRVSLRNFKTDAFGKEVSINGYTNDRVPGKPTNVTFKTVDCHVSTEYCHLNVTWLHPYNQNGTITMFNIILNSTDERKDSEESKYIHEVYKVLNKTYSTYYTYQIKYLPYSTFYNLYLQSANDFYKSDFTELIVKTDSLGDHIDQNPKLIAKSNTTLIFKIPHLDRRLDYYTLTILVQDFNISKTIDRELLKNRKIADNLCHGYGETWISQIIKVDSNRTDDNVIIGSPEKEKLIPNSKYCVTFIITNKYKGTEHDVVYYETLKMPDQPKIQPTSTSQFNHLYMLLLLLLLVPIGFLIYRYLKKKRILTKPEENNENVYETLPFDECETNCVTNDNYDELIINK